jgi:hypothetical protein
MLRGRLRVTSGLCDRRLQLTTLFLRGRRGCTTSVMHTVCGRRCAWTESDIGSRSTRACRWVVKMCVRGSQLFGAGQNEQMSTLSGRRDLAKGWLFGADSKAWKRQPLRGFGLGPVESFNRVAGRLVFERTPPFATSSFGAVSLAGRARTPRDFGLKPHGRSIEGSMGGVSTTLNIVTGPSGQVARFGESGKLEASVSACQVSVRTTKR